MAPKFFKPESSDVRILNHHDMSNEYAHDVIRPRAFKRIAKCAGAMATVIAADLIARKMGMRPTDGSLADSGVNAVECITLAVLGSRAFVNGIIIADARPHHVPPTPNSQE